MRTNIKKWGNSAAVRIPSSIMQAARLKLDETVDVREQDGQIVIKPKMCIRDSWEANGRDGHLLLSFHGIPQSYVARGDRYAEECRQTAAQLAAALGLAAGEWSLSFQSRFGANRWLTPATEKVLRELPGRGVRRLTVLCPGFAADCLETLEEIALTGRASFLGAGGERFGYVPALNAREHHVRALAQLILRSTGDWT